MPAPPTAAPKYGSEDLPAHFKTEEYGLCLTLVFDWLREVTSVKGLASFEKANTDARFKAMGKNAAARHAENRKVMQAGGVALMSLGQTLSSYYSAPLNFGSGKGVFTSMSAGWTPWVDKDFYVPLKELASGDTGWRLFLVHQSAGKPDVHAMGALYHKDANVLAFFENNSGEYLFNVGSVNSQKIWQALKAKVSPDNTGRFAIFRLQPELAVVPTTAAGGGGAAAAATPMPSAPSSAPADTATAKK